MNVSYCQCGSIRNNNIISVLPFVKRLQQLKVSSQKINMMTAYLVRHKVWFKVIVGSLVHESDL